MVEQLRKYLPVPDVSDDAPASMDAFLDIEKQLSCTLPTDYKHFVLTYGTGWIGDIMLIYTPFSSKEDFNLLKRVKRRKDYRIIVPNVLPIYPEKDGMLPLAYIQDNGSIFWHTKSPNPDEWTIVLTQTRGEYFETYDMNLLAFLLNIFSNAEGSLLKTSKIIGQDDFDFDLPFVPHSLAE
ncbi:MAG: SMI1/KNR4 family protein [Chloroflexota bacterium]